MMPCKINTQGLRCWKLSRLIVVLATISLAMQLGASEANANNGNAAAASAEIRIDCKKPTVPLSPHLYGLFFEDINYGADGGLYAELVQNRSFEYYPVEGWNKLAKDFHPLYAWTKVERNGARCDIAVVDRLPLNDKNTKYLELKIDQPGAGVSNGGFNGIPIDAGADYDVSLYARTEGWSGDDVIRITLELEDGTVCGSTMFQGVGQPWKKFEGKITADKTTDTARLVVTTSGRGTLCLDMVSLFPQDTYLGRKNGLRKDLVEALKDLNPKFLRFPGGCIMHGRGLNNMYMWKDTVGDVAQRKPNWNLWGYHQTYGLGFYEYFQLCEDLDMQPLPVLPAGVCCSFGGHFQAVPMGELDQHVQNVLDLIEFASGPATSKWGSVRAKMGHPKPFDLNYISLGNEEGDTPQVRERFPYFTRAIHKAHPRIKIVGTSGLGHGIPLYDLMADTKVYSSDEHYYEAPDWFIRNQHRFDTFDRSKPKIFVGEYASKGSTLYNAIAEAAYLTGIERNGDMVDMTCYAPLFGRTDATQWNPDLIYFDKRRVLRTANYYVQQLFSQNKGDVYLANTVIRKQGKKSPVPPFKVGVGSWKTAIEIKDVTVNGRTLDPSTWQVQAGDFHMSDDKYIQTDVQATPAMSLSNDTFQGNIVTYTLRARKAGGQEGFLIRFGRPDGKEGYCWWNVGGWNNTSHAIEQIDANGSKASLAKVRGSIREGQWYDLKIELSPDRVKCFLDGQLIHDCIVTPPAISVSSTLDRSAGEVIVKLVNPTADPVEARITLQGVESVEPTAQLVSLSGKPDAVNTFDQPDAVKPKMSKIKVASEFTHTIPAMAVQVIRVKQR